MSRSMGGQRRDHADSLIRPARPLAGLTQVDGMQRHANVQHMQCQLEENSLPMQSVCCCRSLPPPVIAKRLHSFAPFASPRRRPWRRENEE